MSNENNKQPDVIDGQVKPEQTKTMAREPRGRLTREDIAKIEIGHTEVKRSTAWTLILLFLAIVFAVPVSQHMVDIRAGLAGERPTPVPQFYDIFRMLPASAEKAAEEKDSVIATVFTANRYMLKDINVYEDEMKAQSVLTEGLVPPAQLFMSRFLGVGNEKGFIGREGWLFYRPGVKYLTGKPFLAPDRLAAIEASGSEWRKAPQPDPRKAIVQFRDQLAERGIELIVMPTPVKPMIHPEMYTRRADGRQIVQNPSYGPFVEQLRAEGVRVFEPGDVLMARKLASGRPQYHKADTHWLPDAMQTVAARLAETARQAAPLRSVSSARYVRKAEQVTNLGDIAIMLKLPEWQTLFPPETVTIQRVRTAEGQDWAPSGDAEVLLLGDSFSNIYSLGEMNWGSSAGLAEQLACELAAPVDLIAKNDNGSHATREALRLDLARGVDRLAGKKVVIWQFAIRELAVGDWKLMDMKLGEKRAPTTVAAEGLTVQGVVAAASAPRDPDTVYPDYLRQLHVTDLTVSGGELGEADIVVYVWSLRGGKPQPGDDLKPGDRVRLKLQPWEKASATVGRLNRSDLDDMDLMLKTPWWAAEMEKQ